MMSSNLKADLTMLRFTRCAVAAVALSLAPHCLAASPPIMSDQLQQDAMSCVGEAVQICPEVMTAEDHGVSCMVGKRGQFSSRCRLIYDRVAHVMGR